MPPVAVLVCLQVALAANRLTNNRRSCVCVRERTGEREFSPSPAFCTCIIHARFLSSKNIMQRYPAYSSPTFFHLLVSENTGNSDPVEDVVGVIRDAVHLRARHNRGQHTCRDATRTQANSTVHAHVCPSSTGGEEMDGHWNIQVAKSRNMNHLSKAELPGLPPPPLPVRLSVRLWANISPYLSPFRSVCIVFTLSQLLLRLSKTAHS